MRETTPRGMRIGPGVCALLFATTLALSACAQTSGGESSGGLTWPDSRHPDFAMTPRLTGPGTEAINARLAHFDAQGLKERAQCLEMGQERGEFVRLTGVAFTGPRFLTVVITDDYYCGGAYPSVNLVYLTLDRETAGAPDWASLWPAADLLAASGGDDLLPSTTEAPALADWFRSAVRADPENDAEWLEQCDPWYGADPIQQPLVVWLDAAAGGIALDWTHLPHVAMACGSTQVMPLDVAARLGASPELIEAVRQGHADWIERTPELP